MVKVNKFAKRVCLKPAIFREVNILSSFIAKYG